MNTKYNASNEAYEAIKELILNGHFMPGEKINQDEIAAQLGVSRMPIRRALDMLSQEKIVTVKPHYGAYVTKLDAKAINDIYNLRAQIESMAIILAIQNLTDEDIRVLHEMLKVQEDLKVTDWKNHSKLARESHNFHHYITSLSQNDYLLGIFDTLWEQSECYRRIYYRNLHSEGGDSSEHAEIVRLMEERSAQAASDFIIKHVRKTQAAILQTMGSDIGPLCFKPLYIGETD